MSGLTPGQERQPLISILEPLAARPEMPRLPTTLGTAPQVKSCPEKDKKFKEFDGEAVAFAAPHFYVVGSHGCGRNNDAFRLSSFILARIRVDAEARPVDAQGALLQGEASANAVQTTYRLSGLLRRAPVVGKAFGKSLNQKNGLNIEGLAVAGDRLMVGLRAPAKDKAHMVTASVADLFAPGNAPSTATSEIIPVKLCANAGIRDLAPLGERLLVLSGPAQEQADVRYALFVVEPKAGAKAVRIASIPDAIEDGKRAKAESLTVLEAQGDTLRVLIMFDGPANGAPREYKVSLK